jgi:hypothetical protein
MENPKRGFSDSVVIQTVGDNQAIPKLQGELEALEIVKGFLFNAHPDDDRPDLLLKQSGFDESGEL